MNSFQPTDVHAQLGDRFYAKVDAAQFDNLALRHRNQRALTSIGLGQASDAFLKKHFLDFVPFEESFPQPLALAYHGHQFRHYNPDIGDGRGFLFAQAYDLQGRLLDMGTKGSGQTPFSRSGDGRLTLQGGVREVLAAGMLEHRGVYTSKALVLFETTDRLERHDEPSPTRAGVLTRLSHGHIRIGTFQRLAALGDDEAIEKLVHHCLQYYLTETDPYDDGGSAKALMMFRKVTARMAWLVAEWMAAGFVHGVLNTDNLTITAESFDYGPFRFLERYDPGFTAAYFDHSGLYAYARQPEAVGWALARLAECLIGQASQDDLQVALDGFAPLYKQAWLTQHLKLAGLAPNTTDIDALASGLLANIQKHDGPFVHLHGHLRNEYKGHVDVREISDFPHMMMPMHHKIIEEIWSPIHQHDDWQKFDDFLSTQFQNPCVSLRAGIAGAPPQHLA